MVQILFKRLNLKSYISSLAECRRKINQMAKRKFKTSTKIVIKIDKSLKEAKSQNLGNNQT